MRTTELQQHRSGRMAGSAWRAFGADAIRAPDWLVERLGSLKIGGTFGGTERRRGLDQRQFVFKFGADGRIRTGDPLFANQAAIEFSSRFSLSMYS
jgi:hypothetical protein